MNKTKTLIFAISNLILIILLNVLLVCCIHVSDSMELKIYLGESHAGQRNIAQLFYAGADESFTSNQVLTEVFDDDEIVFEISTIDLKQNLLRLDPFNMEQDFTICRLEINFGTYTAISLTAPELKSYISKVKDIDCEFTENAMICGAKGDNPRIRFNQAFSEKLYHYYSLVNKLPYIVCIAALLIFALIEIWALKIKGLDKVKKYMPFMIVSDILLVLGVLFIYVIFYFENYFGQVPFGQLVYHLHTPLDGTDLSSYKSVILFGIFLVAGSGVLCWILYLLLRKKQLHTGYVIWVGMFGALLISYALMRGCIHFDILAYYEYTHESTTIYEDYYVDGRDVTLTFPEEKRNLIYIFLESMEITYADVSSGGIMQENYIPELTALSMQNTNFSDGAILNGAYHVSGATYTMGALTAQTSGVPINEALVSNDTLNSTWESENNYLPGVWSIGDVLHEAGYQQVLLIGSNGNFAGRSSYFQGHGGYMVEDYISAIEEERIPSDYKVWWGYEDEKLYDFAKEDILELAKSGEPFNFTMLTVDTHATGGYVCGLCGDDYENQYSNVLRCADSQAAEFIAWIMEQDFYENTTIVVAGDHLLPDSYYIASEGADGFDRKVYFTVIHPAQGKEETCKARIYTTLDFYPTTLSSMGVVIEGDRLGLGTDLYSDTPTLAEELGIDTLNTELMKNSEFYTNELLYK